MDRTCFDKLEDVSAELNIIRKLLGTILSDYFIDEPLNKTEAILNYRNSKILIESATDLTWYLEKDLDRFIKQYRDLKSEKTEVK